MTLQFQISTEYISESGSRDQVSAPGPTLGAHIALRKDGVRLRGVAVWSGMTVMGAWRNDPEGPEADGPT